MSLRTFVGAAGPMLLGTLAACGGGGDAANSDADRPVMTVEAVSPRRAAWPVAIVASGNVVAWHEARIDAEISGVRLVESLVDVGDHVRKGQLLARFDQDVLRVELAQQEAAVSEARALLAKARAEVERALRLSAMHAISEQDLGQLRTSLAIAEARLEVAESQREAHRLRVERTRVVAPDGGTISARTATVGAVASVGSELFRLIRNDRLEWRAEIGPEWLPRVAVGQSVAVLRPDGTTVSGHVRQQAPTLDADTRYSIVYIDLPAGSGLAPGMFVSGSIDIGAEDVLSLPQSALVLRDGSTYVLRLNGQDVVEEVKVPPGRHRGDDVEILGGIGEGDRFVKSGGSFVNDGDKVKVAGADAGTVNVVGAP